ncbi:MAG: AsmA family protein, partial [Betaproteobacteria bacterium]|nr:AsmA family protein [Betaproteobacteria bacterium]
MRALRWIAGVFAVLVVAGVLFLFFGLDTLRGPIARAVTNATGRELKIEGRIRPAWDWIHPAFRAERVTFANAPWGKAPFLLRADSLEITLSVTPLLAGRVSLPDVRLERPEVNLEQDADGRRNWVLKDEDPNKPSRIRIRNLALDRGELRYDDAQHNVHVAAELSTDATGVNFEVRGRYRGLAVSGSGHGGPVLA